MAFAEKYYAEFADIHGTAWKISIGKDGYVGGTTQVTCGGTPFQLSRPEADTLDILRPARATVELMAEADLQYSEFFTAGTGDYNVRLIYDPDGAATVKWQGINEAAAYEEPYIDTPYPIKLFFNDGLNLLKRKRWDNAGTLYATQKHVIEVLRLAFNLLPFQLSIREIVNVYEDSHNSLIADSALVQTYVSSKVYREVNKYSDGAVEEAWHADMVIEEVLRSFGPIIVFQWDNKWWVVRTGEYDSSPMYYRQFAAAVGAESGTATEDDGTITPNRAMSGLLNFTGGNQMLTLEQPIDKIALTYKADSVPTSGNDLVRNGLFQQWLTIDLVQRIPLFWTAGSGIDVTVYDAYWNVQQIGRDGDKYFSFKFRQSDVDGLTALDANKYIQTTNPNLLCSTSDKLQLYFEMGAGLLELPKDWNADEKQWHNYKASATVYVKLSIGAYDLVGEGTSATWQTGAASPYLTFASAPFTSSVQGGFFRAWQQPQIGFSLITPVLPETGEKTFTLRIYVPVTNLPASEAMNPNITLTMEKVLVGNVSCHYLTSGNEVIMERTIRHVINDEAEERQITVYHGDGPSSFNEASYRLSDASVTGVWARRGFSETLDIHEVLFEAITRLRGNFWRRLTGAIATSELLNPPYIEMYQQLQHGGISYIFNKFDWDVKANEIGCTLDDTGNHTRSYTLTQFDTTSPRPPDPPEPDDPPPSTPQDMVPAPVLVPSTPVVVKTMDTALMEDYPL